MKSLIILLAIVPFLFGASCKKENLNVLPPATTSGKNIIGGYIDGQLFVSRREDWLSENPKVAYYPAVPELVIHGTSTNIVDGPYLGFRLKENLGQNKLILVSGSTNTAVLTMGHGDTNRYLPDFGHIYITRFDTVTGVFSGTFDITFKSESGKIAHFTEGRFDLKK